jgi:aminoglycoside phosphotransferase (APT) family kinase protein
LLRLDGWGTGPDDPSSRSRQPSLPWQAAARILAAHGLGDLRDLRPLAGGQINPVYLLNREFVLRLRPAERKGGAFLTEAALYARLRGRVPVPDVLAVGAAGSLVDAEYLLARRLPGESLTRAWLAAPAARQERLVSRFSELLRAIHAEHLPRCGGFTSGELQPAPTWLQYFADRFERRLERVGRFPNADRGLLQAIDGHWRRTASALDENAGSDPRLVHRDLHFGNVLVEGERITGALDFEAAVAGPIDYELDQLARFLRYPQLFVEPVLEAVATRERFASVWGGLRHAYPELFAPSRLADRLALYSLEYDLAALHDCYAGRWTGAAHRHVLHRLTTALQGRHLPG